MTGSMFGDVDHPLKGWAALLYVDGNCERQCDIIDVIYNGQNFEHVALVQWLSWFDGSPNFISAIRLSDMYSSSNDYSWRLFRTPEQRNEYYDNREASK